MNDAHTPGPWAVSDKHGSEGAVSYTGGYIAFPCAPRIACEDRTDGESWLDMRDRTQSERDAIAGEQRANTRLIAAAPELLAALKECSEIIEIEGGNAQRYRSLIDKATGVTS